MDSKKNDGIKDLLQLLEYLKEGERQISHLEFLQNAQFDNYQIQLSFDYKFPIESKLSENYQNLDLFPLKLSLNEKMAKENTAEKSSAMLFQFEGQEQFDKFIDQMKERILARMTNIIKMISNSAFELSKWEGE